jgi:hypothetical protein
MSTDDPSEFLRQLGKNFAAWRRINLLSGPKLMKHLDGKGAFSSQLLSKFENGKLSEFLEAAAEAMNMEVKDFLSAPPDEKTLIRDPYTMAKEETEPDPLPGPDDDELAFDAESWRKYNKNTDEEKMRAATKVLIVGHRKAYSRNEQSYLMGMLTGAPRAEGNRYRHRGRGLQCCATPQPVTVDKYTRADIDDGQNVGVAYSVNKCKNCSAEWVVNHGPVQKESGTA